MNAATQMQLAAALADAIEKSGIVVERATFARGNIRGWERVDSGALAARTVGTWLAWGFTASVDAGPADPRTPTSTDPAQRPLRLVTESERINNDDEDDGA